MNISCTVAAPPTPTIPNTMVGFWSIGNQLAAGDYISETANESNVAVLPPDENGQYLPRVSKASSLGLKSVLMVPSLLFNTTFNNGALLPDYQTRFDSMWTALGSAQSDVVGFYIIDEPYWNNQNAGANAIPESQLKANLNAAATYIHQEATGRPVMFTEAYPIVTRSDFASLIPESVDDIGVNCYLAFGAVCSEANTSALVSKLISSKQPNQKLVVTADGYWPSQPTAQNDADLRARILFWEKLLAPYFASNQVGAFTPFIYQDAGSNVHGASEAPSTLVELQRYMTSVKNGIPQPQSAQTNLALGKSVVASGQYAGGGGGTAAQAVDGDTSTAWNSGGFPPQWIQIDLGAPHTITDIKLNVGQSPTGQTTHNVYASATGADASWQLITTFQGDTTDGQVLDYAPASAVVGMRYIKVETTASPSWVAWKEIDVFGN